MAMYIFLWQLGSFDGPQTANFSCTVHDSVMFKMYVKTKIYLPIHQNNVSGACFR